MPLWLLISLVVFLLVVDLIVVVAVGKGMVSNAWGPLFHRYPAVERDPGAVRKEFQSFKIGMWNLGCCVHAAVDVEHLHLDPAWLLRCMGARSASVPLDDLEVDPAAASRTGGRVRVTLNGTDFLGPAWCLRPALVKEQTGDSQEHRRE